MRGVVSSRLAIDGVLTPTLEEAIEYQAYYESNPIMKRAKVQQARFVEAD